MASMTSKPASNEPISQMQNRPLLSGTQQREIKAFGKALLFLAPSLILFITFVFVPLVRTVWLSSYT